MAFFIVNFQRMKEQELHFNCKARYYTQGELNPSTKRIWFVLHGYGQLAKFFISKFKAVSDAGVYVIAPEGLSKFYLEDVTSRARTGNNRVGATWMTRENRISDIENYIAYLNSVYKKEVPHDYQGEISFFGFSQGAATATRWAIDGNHVFHQLILWAGILPPDMNFEKAHEILKDKKIMEVFGKTDPYLTDERLKEVSLLNTRLNIHPTLIEFDGGHEINEEVLKDLIKSN
jgi:predicted esterase